MCGIAGFNWRDEKLLGGMMDSMSSRGPDDSGTYFDDTVSLGHRRLSIIDLSKAAHQPMRDGERTIVYNGELYNFKELKVELASLGHKFTTESDTEVILASHKQWGPECLKRFRGMYAFAIHDVASSSLFVARDHVGIKPLYYYHQGGKFAFASTINALLTHGIKTAPNRKLIRDFLLYNITDHTNETFFTGLNKFPKGHYGLLDLKNAEFKIVCWYDVTATRIPYSGSYETAVLELRKRLVDSIRRHMVSDVPLGSCLSGGIDSSSIVYCMNSIGANKISTFSGVFPGHAFNEEGYIDKISQDLGLDGHKIMISAEAFRSDIHDFVRSMGEPVPGPSPYAQYQVFKRAKEEGVTVLLDGQGADELFAGYHYFYGFYGAGMLSKFRLGRFLDGIQGALTKTKSSIALKSFVFLIAPRRTQVRHFVKMSNISKALLEDVSAESSYFDDYYGSEDLPASLRFHMDSKLEHLLRWEDSNSMAHSRESRVPFLDVDVIEFALSLPPEFIMREGWTKGVLRDAMRGIVMDEILDRKDKIGFGTPEEAWLREPYFKPMLESFMSGAPACSEYVDVKRTREMMRAHASGKSDHGRAIWKTLMLEKWLRIYFPQHAGPSEASR
jgi:asparagine synthase (glutamine-hydrolysing)